MVPQNQSIAELAKWYRKRLKKQISGIKNIKSNLNFLLFSGVFTAVLLLLMGLASYPDQVGNALGPLLLLLLLPTIGFVMVWNSKKELNLEIDEILLRCQPLDETEYAVLYDLCYSVVARMNLEVSFEILYVKNNSFFPGIIEKDGKTYLLYPRNFIKLSCIKPDYAKAILFHEFAHVVQKDSNNFFYLAIITRKMKVLGVLYLLATIIVCVITERFGISLVTLFGLGSFYALKSTRIDSEVLADTSVLLYDDGRYLVAALKEYGTSDNKEKNNHFPPETRIRIILDKMSRYGLDRMTEPASAENGPSHVDTVVANIKSDWYNIDILHDQIVKEKKRFFKIANQGVVDITRTLVHDYESCEQLCVSYQQKYGADLIKELCSLSSHYPTIEWYVGPFIEYGYCKEKYPHDHVASVMNGNIDG